MTFSRSQLIRHATSRPLPLAALVADVMVSGWCLALVAITLLVAWRRLAGALTAPGDNAVLLVACLTAALLSLLGGRTPLAGPLSFVNAVGPLVLAAVLTFPQSGWPVWLMLWSVSAVPLVGVLNWSGTRRGRSTPGPLDVRSSFRPPASAPPVAATSDAGPADVVQQLTRGSTATGSDTLVGRIRVRLDAGVRSQRAHVAFCPPFDGTPSVAVEATDPSGPQVRVGQVLPQGVRFDLKRRSGSDLDAVVEIRFRAVDQSTAASE